MDTASGCSVPLPADGLPVIERSVIVMRLVVLDAGPGRQVGCQHPHVAFFP